MSERFRCSVAAAAEPLAGTAAVDRAFLLIEHPTPWGRKALDESRLPEPVRTGLAERAARAGVRIQLVRRHARRVTSGRVFLAHAGPADPWLETTVLDDPEALLELDLDGLAAGRSAGFDRHDAPLLLVCTNGRRDTCCAEQGRPLAATLDTAYPELTWETTHLGGHRFAGALMVLRHGLAYGRVGSDDGLRIAELTLQGRIDLDHLRGRAAYPGAVQAAEVALLRRLGEDRIDALTLVAHESDGALSSVTFDAGGASHLVEVDEVHGPPIRQSCADLKTKTTVSYLPRQLRLDAARSSDRGRTRRSPRPT